MLAGAGCTLFSRSDEAPAPRDALGAEVDSVVVAPFSRGPDVPLNDADLALFQQHLRRALEKRERLRSYDTPPTNLPNTALLNGKVERADVVERRAPGVHLRSIEITATLGVRPAPMTEPKITVRRAVTWQKAYADSPVSSVALDLEDAVRELMGQFAATLAPLPPDEPPVWRAGGDADGDGQNAALERGNRFAAKGWLHHAELAWLHTLFSPTPPDDEREYRVSALTLNHLRDSGTQRELVERLEPMTALGPMPLPEFRTRLRETLERDADRINALLPLMDTLTNATRRNLAAAHENLGTLYAQEGRGDLAAYHWARAWAHDPDEALLKRWRDLQADRAVLPRNLSAREAMKLYLRMPPPATVRVQPGAFERRVLPEPAFPEAMPVSQPRRGDSAAQLPPPVERPPVAEPTALEVTSPGRAAGSSPRGGGGGSVPAVAPAAR